MASGSFRFDRFTLDCRDRQLRFDDAPVELNARYLDALVLLVREQGRLVSKDQFLEEVWRGIPVTDEALTQCIRTLRRQLGDSATLPRFIETVPKHGYRFLAPVELLTETDAPLRSEARRGLRAAMMPGLAGTAGAGIGGIIGGLLYGFVAASQPADQGPGAASVLLVVTSATVLVALLGGAGVAFGIASARFATEESSPWAIAGGAAGGLVVGAVVKLLGLDAFGLLLGHAPAGITGAPEGALLGGAVGLGAWLTRRAGASPRRGAALAALIGACGGTLVNLLGGRLMAGSLALLTRSFPESRLRLDQLGALFGESGFGPVSQTVTSALEGALFAGCVVGAMLLASRRSGAIG